MLFKRRIHYYISLLAITFLALAATAAEAAAPQVRTQGPGFYRMMLGTFEITALLDGTHDFPVPTVMQGLSQDDIARDLSREDLSLPVQGSINAFLINTGSKLILVDSGAGTLYGPCCGHLLSNLRAAGYEPAQVDEVLITHLHKDHVGGIVLDGKMAFPNAVVRVSDTDADYWLNADKKKTAPAFLSTFFDAAKSCLQPYVDAGRFKRFKAGQELEPGIVAMATPGHTPGHTSYLVKSGDQTMLIWGDIVHVAALQLHHPEVSVEYDSDAALAKQSRDTVFKLVSSQRLWVAAAHMSYPGLGHLRKDPDGYEWIPINYDAAPGQH